MSSRVSVLRAVTTGFLLLVTTAVGAQETPVGKVTLESKSVAVGIGVSWGEGKLLYQDKEYAFSINGLSVVDLGISKASATGEVFNLKKVSDFSGNYVTAQAAAGLAAGAGAMKNQNGVVMHLTGTGTGVKLALGPTGVDVKLKQ